MFEVLQNLKRALDGSGRKVTDKRNNHHRASENARIIETVSDVAIERRWKSLASAIALIENNNRTTSPPSSSSGQRRNTKKSTPVLLQNTTGSALQSQKPTWKTRIAQGRRRPLRWKHQP